MSETDPDFHKALEAGKIMSLSGESHRSGPEYGTVGYDKKRYGQLLLFPKSLKAFAHVKIIGIKYDLFAQDSGIEEKGTFAPRSKGEKRVKKKRAKSPMPKKSGRKTPAKEKKAEPKPAAKKVIPFPGKEQKHDEEDEDGGVVTFVHQAMRALEKGNSVAAYNILKQIIGGP
jgi:hypothetical protein